MRMSIIAFAAGVWFLQQQAALPGWPALAALLAVSAGLAVAAAWMRHRRSAPAHIAVVISATLAAAISAAISAALIGFIWAAAMGQIRLADTLPEENEGRDILLTGVIASLPQAYDNGVRFDFAVEQAASTVPAKISLAWSGGARQPWRDVHAGERWQFTVRLKRPHGNLNPHGFDYEAWLFERGVRAAGYVRNDDGNRRLDAFVPRPAYAVERLREKARARFLRALPQRDYAGVLVALAVGDQRAIDSGLWQLFARTGISHLMSISGLHVTMVAALGGWLAAALWRRRPALLLRLPAQKVAAASGWATAFAYCLLAGFGVPAQRTLYMLTVVALALWLGRAAAGSRVLALALLLVLLVDPWAVLSAGFWLSFGAVAVLFYVGAGRLAARHWLAEWGRAQWAVTLGLIPALLAIFQQFSLVSPLANAVAIPVVSFVITPLTLIAAALPFDALLLLAHQILSWLMAFIEWLAALPLAMWQQHTPPVWAVGLAALGCVWLLLPRGFPSRGMGALLLLPLALAAPARPAEGELRLTVLDVGHGVAVHAQTAKRDLIYDTGPQFSPDANSGNRILLPYLRAAGVRRLDALILSHEDQDHAGGALSLIDGLPLTWTMNSMPAGHPFREAPGHRTCEAGQTWTWDGVRFEILHPEAAAYAVGEHDGKRKGNDMSCVLKIVSAHGSALLAGDIETTAERTLLKQRGGQLRADALLAPHHGSRSSSSPEFLAAVGARTAIFSIGYRNRFRHPHETVWRRYEASGAQLLRTDRDGAVTIEFAAPWRITTERAARRRYWHGR
ncbi:MAG: DNA internalization-related competence protein ComEC/Rec2 [Zoogloeaceae bacterium]|jgi:competence protein ComEC|nr:DNA internalization-related competence protein ComEC/Rec2 [Zoogloeaceae bacterium]